MIFLIDHNIEGQALLLFGTLVSEGWTHILPIRFVTFDEVQLPIDSSDRVVWQFAQDQHLVLLTANRSMKGKDSLEEVLRQEAQANSFPVVTIAKVDRIVERAYREACADRLIEIILSLDNYLGVRRLFIP